MGRNRGKETREGERERKRERERDENCSYILITKKKAAR